VLESNVHFPTDANLLFDAARKSIEYASKLSEFAELGGWRKAPYWTRKLKSRCHSVGRLFYYGGKNKSQKIRAAAEAYLKLARQLSQKLDRNQSEFESIAEHSEKYRKVFENYQHFKGHLDKHIDLVSRRLIDGESISHSEKVFSLFEPYTEWIKRGKAAKRQELGLKIAIAQDQFGFIIANQVMQKKHDKDIAVPITEAMLKTHEIESISFDKNFWTPENHRRMSQLVQVVVMPKKGKRNQQEYEREHSKTFKALRKQHSAIESAINCLEHHGLNRCPDRGLHNFKKYTALGVLACNLHKLGNLLQEKERILSKNKPFKKAA
jgi:hypothetical protein